MKLSMVEVHTLQLPSSSFCCACDTFQGQLCTEGLVGVTRAFISAGAQTAVSSLWKVDDAVTTFMMERSYIRLSESASDDSMGALYVCRMPRTFALIDEVERAT